MDELIVIKDFDNIKTYINNLGNKISNVILSQIIFQSRFINMDKLITSINKADNNDLPRKEGNKNIYKADKAKK